VTSEYDAAAKSFALTLTQTTPPTPGQSEKKPLHIPLALALFDDKGAKLRLCASDASEQENSRGLFELETETRTIRFSDSMRAQRFRCCGASRRRCVWSRRKRMRNSNDCSPSTTILQPLASGAEPRPAFDIRARRGIARRGRGA